MFTECFKFKLLSDNKLTQFALFAEPDEVGRHAGGQDQGHQ